MARNIGAMSQCNRMLYRDDGPLTMYNGKRTRDIGVMSRCNGMLYRDDGPLTAYNGRRTRDIGAMSWCNEMLYRDDGPLTAYYGAIYRYIGPLTAYNEASAPSNQASNAYAESLTAYDVPLVRYDEPMSWAEFPEEAFRMTHNPQSEAEIGDVTVWIRGGFTMEPAVPGASNALSRTAAEYAALWETSLTTAETAQRLGVDPSRVRQLLAARKLYGLQIKGVWKIPAFQFEGDRLLSWGPIQDQAKPSGRSKWFNGVAACSGRPQSPRPPDVPQRPGSARMSDSIRWSH